MGCWVPFRGHLRGIPMPEASLVLAHCRPPLDELFLSVSLSFLDVFVFLFLLKDDTHKTRSVFLRQTKLKAMSCLFCSKAKKAWQRFGWERIRLPFRHKRFVSWKSFFCRELACLIRLRAQGHVDLGKIEVRWPFSRGEGRPPKLNWNKDKKRWKLPTSDLSSSAWKVMNSL